MFHYLESIVQFLAKKPDEYQIKKSNHDIVDNEESAYQNKHNSKIQIK